MGGIFGGGPSDGDIRRAEEKAYQKEAERLRLQEKKLRQRESAETMQGQGIATTGNISLGNDMEQDYTGLDRVTATELPEKPVASESQRSKTIQEALKGLGSIGISI